MRQKNTIIIRNSSAEKKCFAFLRKAFFALFLVPCLLSHVSLVAQAATLGVTVSSLPVMVGEPIRVDVGLDTEGDTMNAIQGTISFPSNLFSLQSISDGNSIVSFWVDSPSEIASGEVTFSGIVPGGFQGAATSVMGLVLTPLAEGSGTISLDNIKLLRNDGQGSSISVTSTPAIVDISAAASNTSPLPPQISLVSPESFTPVISENSDVYSGKYFLVFSTTDKGSGIDYYEVLEVPTGQLPSVTSSWHVATSPYLLQDQGLTSDIYVRAVDYAGNSIVVKLPARFPASSKIISHRMVAIALLVLLFLVVIIGFSVRWRMVRYKK